MVHVVLLGVAQDGGRPQPGCVRACCAGLGPEDARHPVALGVTDAAGHGHLIEATRAMGEQLRTWGQRTPSSVTLTHAHFGHVDGLGLLGKETMGLADIPLHASSSMIDLIERTPMWSELVKDGVLLPQPFDGPVELGEGVRLEPVPVPHRAELSDMHAMLIRGPSSSLLFLPDHDTWEATLRAHNAATIRNWLDDLGVDVALIDGTFWSDEELVGRHQGDVPHPPVSETLERLGPRQEDDPDIVFIHLNHTNPLHNPSSREHKLVHAYGWRVGRRGDVFTL